MEEYIKIKDPLDQIVIRVHRLGSFVPGTKLVRPNAQRYKNLMGRVVQVGSSFHPKDYRGYRIQEGDEIIFRNWNVLREASWAGKNLHLVKFDGIVGVIEK